MVLVFSPLVTINSDGGDGGATMMMLDDTFAVG